MSKRTILAVGLLVVWAGALGWHVKREYFPARSALLTRGASGIPPGPAYYRLSWDDRRLGWARVEVDTLPGGGFDLATLLEMQAAPLGISGTLRAETTARLGGDLGLQRFSASAGGSLLSGLSGGGALASLGGPGAPADSAGRAGSVDSLRAEGRLEGDSTLVTVLRRGGGPEDTLRFSTGGDLVPLGALPIRLAADPRIEPGRRVAVRLLDPRSASVRTVELRVRESARRIFPDSARRDTARGGWAVAGRDTVRAWRVTPVEGGLPVSAWVDEDGRLLEARLGSSLRMERTAFELAFYPADSVVSRDEGSGGRPQGLQDPRDGGMP